MRQYLRVPPENNVIGERSEHANSNMAAGVVTWRRDKFSGRVDDQCRYLLAKFRPQEVPWVPGGSGPSSCPYSAECVEGKFLELRHYGVLRSRAYRCPSIGV